MPEKIDIKQQYKSLYFPGRAPEIVRVPRLTFLQIDGQGNPASSPAYPTAVSTLYSAAYALKFAVKKQLGIDFAVMPLEGLWWMADGSIVSDENKDFWSWTMMIVQPEWVTPALLDQVLPEVRKKKATPCLDDVRLEAYEEGDCVQRMYTGPYTGEHESIMELHAHALAQGYRLEGKHHEIYLNDPQRTAPERLKTILRQPLAR